MPSYKGSAIILITSSLSNYPKVEEKSRFQVFCLCFPKIILPVYLLRSTLISSENYFEAQKPNKYNIYSSKAKAASGLYS